MKSLEARLDRLEAVQRPLAAEISPAEIARVHEDVRRVLDLVQPGADPDVVFAEILRGLETGTRTDEGLAAAGGVNLEILRVVASARVSDCPLGAGG